MTAPKITPLPFPVRAVGAVGRAALQRIRFYQRAGVVLGQALRPLLRLRLFNHAVVFTTIRQIYFTGVEALPILVFTAVALGGASIYILADFLKTFNQLGKIGPYFNAVVVNELAPLIASFLVLFRSGPAVTAEISLMEINGEFDALNMLKIDQAEYVVLPRVLAFVVCGPALALAAAAAAHLTGLAVMGFWHDYAFETYIELTLMQVSVKNTLMLFVKPLVMSLVACLVSIAAARGSAVLYTQTPIRVIKGMMHGIAAVIAVELAFLLLLH